MTHANLSSRFSTVPVTDLPTLPVFPGVSKFFIKSPCLTVRAPNLAGTTYCGSFYISLSLIIFRRQCAVTALKKVKSKKKKVR